MSNMEIKELQANEICNIIKQCAKSGVKTLKLGGFEVEFRGWGTNPSPAGMQVDTPSDSGTNASKPVEPLELSEEDKQALQDLEDNQTMLDDPLQWEQDIIDSHMHGEVKRDGREAEKFRRDESGGAQ